MNHGRTTRGRTEFAEPLCLRQKHELATGISGAAGRLTQELAHAAAGSATDFGYVDSARQLQAAETHRNAENLQVSEQTHRVTEAVFAAIISSAVDAVVSVGADNRITLFNRGAEEMFGFSAEEAVGKPLELLIPTHFAEAHQRHMRASAAGTLSRRMGQRRPVLGKRKNGEVFPADISISTVEAGGELILTALVRDATEQKRVEDALRASERRLSDAERIAHLGHWDWDLRTHRLVWSDEVFRILGIQPGEFDASYAAFLSRVHPDDREHVDGAVHRAIKAGTPYSLDHRITRPDGTVRIVHEQGEMALDSDGRTARLLGTIQDVTEARQATDALESWGADIYELHRLTSEPDREFSDKLPRLVRLGCQRLGVPTAVLSRIDGCRYEVVAAHSPDGATRAGDVLDLSETCASITANARQPLEFDCHTEPPPVRPGFGPHQVQAYIGVPVFVGDQLYGTLDFMSGERRQRKTTEADRAILNLMSQWIGSELKRKRTEDALRLLADSGIRLGNSLDGKATLNNVARLAVPAFADACLVWWAGPTTAAPQVAAAATDPQHEMLLLDMLPQDPLPWLLAEPLRTGEPLLLESVSDALFMELVQSDRQLRGLRELQPHSCVVVPLRTRESVAGAIIFTASASRRRFGPDDLMVAKQLASHASLAIENARLYAEAGAAIRARAQVLGVVSHDLRNHLNTISMITQLLLEDGISNSEVDRRRLTMLSAGIHQMTRLVEDLKDGSSIEAGRLSTAPVPCTPGDLVEQAVAIHRDQAAEHQLTCTVNLTEQLPLVMADPGRILQVFSNLMSNAFKFTPRGGTIAVRAEASGNDVVFTVTDSGQGIEPDQLPLVFDRFWQGTKTAAGTGLGLAIVRGIVEAHGGSIWVESEVGSGTSFHFTLPAAPSQPR